ncbi:MULTISPECIES: ABC transporter ATP-binding protein [Actinomadura]|uniref:Dipeptide ABC transporter ATP-binding protein n=1 Tax=Actinomadura litoris TaxID=2678616 RepID=A0A7K1KSD2_9ACTN|nr:MULTISPECIES: ABC transporter ATP-binding protein [Actinomadura]MBT2208067.1 ABC transporter ATP-binding protein [Actinomadura sp. NEAU-AAG7]MUN35090.1 dipeptide ABC transporter ATP-binding protein [Actinomadura litoris]
MKAVEVTGLTVTLDDGSVIANDVSFSLDTGQVMGLVGESGSGKSTVGLALLGFAKSGANITGGKVVVGGVDLLALGPKELREARKKLIGFVPQDPATALNPAMRIGTQLTEGLLGGKKENLPRIRKVLEDVGLPSDDAFLRRHPQELSGGQQQRVAIAMAVAKGPKLIVFDEPTTGLDVSTQARVLEMVAGLCCDNGMAAVFVSHDLAVVGTVGDLVTVMYAGQILETGSREEVLLSAAHPYSIALLESVPSTRQRLPLVAIPGRAPAAGAKFEGCVFADRCAFVEDRCREAAPEMVTTSTGSQARCIRVEHVLQNQKLLVKEPLHHTENKGGDRQAVLSVRNLNASYNRTQVLYDLSFDVAPGECLAVVGESGSGKTTMSRCLIGLHEEQTGDFEMDGKPLPSRLRDRPKAVKQQMQYVFQNPYGSLNPRETVATAVTVPLRHFYGERGKAARTKAQEALERVEIPWRLADRYPAELSGGQRQRVAIARALACNPSLLICDEVTSGLDVSVQASVVELLRTLQDDGLSMVFITHNLAVVRSIGDQVVVLSKGRVVESGAVESVLTDPQHPYTQGLLADTLEVDRSDAETSDLTG